MASKSKQVAHQEDVARQKEEVRNFGNQFLAQLIPGSPEFNQFQSFVGQMVERTGEGAFAIPELGGASVDQQEAVRRFGQQLVSQQQARVAGATGPVIRTAEGETVALGPNDPIPPGATIVAPSGTATPLEARTQQSIDTLRQAAGFRPEEQDILDLLRGGEVETPFGKLLGEGLTYTPEQQDIFQLLRGGTTTTPFGGRLGEGIETTPEQLAFLNAVRGIDQTTPAGRILSQTVRQAEQPIEAFDQYESTFPQLLDLVRQTTESQFARRGITPTSGLALEGLGRAGVEAAIAEATRRQQARAQAESLKQQSYQNFLGVLEGAQAVPPAQQNVLKDLFNTAQQLQTQQQGRASSLYGLGQDLRGREIGLEEAVRDIQLGRETNLTGLLERQSTTQLQNLLGLLTRSTGRAEEQTDAEVLVEEQRRQELINLGKQLAAAAASVAFPTGTPAFFGAANLGASPRQLSAPTLPSPVQQGTAPFTIEQQLASQRASPQATSNLATQLSRQPISTQDADLEELLRQLAGTPRPTPVRFP